MLTLNIELLESKTRPDALPEAVSRLRSMRGDPKTIACFNYVMEVLSTFNPTEVSRFLEDARKTSKSVSTFQVWSETSLQLYYPNQDEELYGFIDTKNLGSPLLGDRWDHNLARSENLEHSQYTPSVVPQLASGSTLMGPVNRFPHDGEKPDRILDGIYNSDECMPPSGLVNTPCSDPAATPVSVTPPQFVHQPCWYSTYSQTVPPELFGYGGLDMALLEWIFQPAPALLGLEPAVSDDEVGKEPTQIRQMTFAPVIEDVVFKPLDSALLPSNNSAAIALKATVVPSKIGDWPYWWHI